MMFLGPLVGLGLGYFWLMLLSRAFLLIFVVLTVVLAIRLLTRTPSIRQATLHSEAIEILKTRYAKGEISKEEFEGLKKDIAS